MRLNEIQLLNMTRGRRRESVAPLQDTYDEISYMMKQRNLQRELIYRKGNVGFYKIGDGPIYYLAIDEQEGKLRTRLLGAVKVSEHYNWKRNIKNAVQISTVQVKPRHRGFNIGLELYRAIILGDGKTLVSDVSQTAGGMSIWVKLAKDPRIEMKATLHPISTRTKLYDVDVVNDEIQTDISLYYDEDDWSAAALAADYVLIAYAR